MVISTEKKRESGNTRRNAVLVLLVMVQIAFCMALNSSLLSCTSSFDLQISSPGALISPTTTNSNPAYIPSSVEEYIMNHAVALGYDNKSPSSGCTIWNNTDATVSPEIRRDLQSYSKDLEQYNTAIHDFEPIPELLKSIQKTGNHDVCASAQPHPDGIEALFPSKQLSLSKSEFVEPLTPPMRDHRICENQRKYLMSLEYLVHDFEAMCRTLKPHSKRILIDMGASLKFHGGKNVQPIVTLLNQYEKFGFAFDHIYGFEITPTPPKEAYDLIPEKFMTSFHWINVGVTAEDGNKLNPLHSILAQFDKDDFIVVKLDIDTSSIEVPLARQLLEDKDGIYTKLVDHFYFEHHVHLKELRGSWWRSMVGSVKDSLDLFYGLREKGIPAHFWP